MLVLAYNKHISARARKSIGGEILAVTIKQIAELAGVSRGTVDRALNERGGVNSEVQKRIKGIAKEQNYVPNPVAKALANSKNRVTVGVLINSGGNSFFDKVLLGINKAKREVSGYGVNLVLEEMTGYDPKIQIELIEKLAQMKINGLIITPINDSEIIKKLNRLAKSGIKITTLNADVTGLEKLCFVGCDYLKSGQTAAELLGQFSTGEMSVCIVTGSKKMLGHNKRIEGFEQVLKASYHNIRVVETAENNDSDTLSYEVTSRLIEKNSPDAIYFCAGGIDGGIKAVMEKNSKNIKIITVDDTQNIKSYIQQNIVNATVCQQPVKQGYDAVMVQYEYLVNGKKPHKKHLYTQNEVKLKYNLD